MTGDDPTTEELQAVQLDRMQRERAAAEEADLPAEERTHRRRADKAAYLAKKLEEQGEAPDS